MGNEFVIRRATCVEWGVIMSFMQYQTLEFNKAENFGELIS